MGNCLTLQAKVIKVITRDGEVLEYKPPVSVHHVLSKLSGHAMADTSISHAHLSPDTELISGRSYHLLPLEASPLEVKKKKTTTKKVRFSDEVAKDEEERGVVRIKLVISKKELEMMLRQERASIEKMVSQLQMKKTISIDDKYDSEHQDESGGSMERKPFLGSIPEVN